MNSATLPFDKTKSFDASLVPPALTAEKKPFFLDRRKVLFLFRSLVFATLLALFLDQKNGASLMGPHVALFFAAFFFSVSSVLFFKVTWIENKKILSAVFMVDVVFITAAMWLAGIAETDLFLVFFTTIFISALSQDVKSVFSVAAVASALYGFLQYKTTGQFITNDTVFLMKFPFIFVAAAMSGYLAMETKKNREESQRLVDQNRFLATQADASAQKLLEMNRKLKALLEYHHCVLSSIKTGIIVARKEGTIRTFNAGARQITGFVEAEMAERTLEELPAELSVVSEALKRTLQEEKTFVQDSLELVNSRHESVPVTLETSVLRGGNGQVIGAIATLKDMTLLNQLQTQLLRAERFSALGEMAAGVAHEIKNPLNAILGFSKRLADKLEQTPLKRYAEIIGEEVKRMDGIVNDVLEYSRPDRLHPEPSDLHQLLRETADFVSEKAERHSVKIGWDLSSDVSAVPVDIPKVRQVLLNLSLNAIQAMEKGGTLTFRTRLVEGLTPGNPSASKEVVLQQLFLQQKMTAIEVEDTGCGIPKENLAKLFHPFFTTKITGTGLGLSICQKIVSSHGGMLDVQSAVGKGSVFTLYLPMER